MSKISKLSLETPNAELMIIEDGYIKKNYTINVKKDISKHVFNPTLYKSWYDNKTSNFVKFKEKKVVYEVNNEEILIIFDSFGCSSYYHLLVDTIIPLWITKNVVLEHLKFDKNKQVNFLDTSNTSNENYLKTINTIFKHFLKSSYIKANLSGKYKYIVYGYCYNHRPYHGPEEELRFFPKYKYMFDKFYDTFTPYEETNERYVIIPLRTDRNYKHMDLLCETVSKYYKTKIVDFSNYSIKEQIKLSNGAWAMIGSEGAGLSNQIFMKKKSLIVCIGEFYKFHSSLSMYLEHNFYNLSHNNDNCINDILKLLKVFEPTSLIR